MAAHNNIEEYLDSLNPDLSSLVEQVRNIVKKTLPEATEQIKWGNLNYAVNGKEVAWIMAYKDHINFGFPVGSQLKSDHLDGTGKGMRHIKISSAEDIAEQEFAKLLRQANDIVNAQ